MCGEKLEHNWNKMNEEKKRERKKQNVWAEMIYIVCTHFCPDGWINVHSEFMKIIIEIIATKRCY